MTRRILILAHAHPEENPTGGELAAYEVFKALRERGWDAHFAAPRFVPRLVGERLMKWEGRPDEWELPYGETELFLLSQRSPLLLRAYAELLERLRPDVVHLHHYIRSGVEAIAHTRRVLPQARVFVTLHEFLAICAHNGQMLKTGDNALCERSSPEECAFCYPDRTPGDFSVRRRYVLANLLKADRLISPSEFLRRRYIDWGVPEDRIVFIENHVPYQAPLPPRPLPAGGRRNAFGYFGSIGLYKGVRQLVEAFQLFRSMPEGADATLTFHGVPGYLPRDFELWLEGAKQRGAPAIRWTGRYARHELPGLMAAIDWVVVPSIWWENSPLVIQEALMAARPLLVSDIGGMAEKVRNGIDGFTFPPGNLTAMAETMAFAVPRFDSLQPRDMQAEIAARLDALIEVYTAPPVAARAA
jgi:glycosyltransferase involved in cell wall biosynthesis